MDSKELSSISDCFGDKKAIKTPKLHTIWLELIARVLNMLIGLKGDNYYSKVFKRVNYKLSNNTFWVVIRDISEREAWEKREGKRIDWGKENKWKERGKEEHGYAFCKILGDFIIRSFIRFFLCMLGYHCDVWMSFGYCYVFL